MAPSSKFLDLLPPAPLPPMQKRDAQHNFLQHKRAHTESWSRKSPPWHRAVEEKGVQTMVTDHGFARVGTMEVLAIMPPLID